MRRLVVLLVLGFSCAIFARTESERVQALVDAFSHFDLMPTGMSEVHVSDVMGPCVDELGCETNQFMSVLRSYCTNVCVRGDMASRTDRARFKGALELLDAYSPEDSIETFAFCATNNGDAALVRFATLAYAKPCGVDARIAFYDSPGVADLSDKLRDSVCKGIVSAFDLNGGDGVSTNKMACFAIRMLSAQIGCWGGLDESLCAWWPAYATSSNRYVAAQRALQADPPRASSNYLARVIAELEALPPGTMQMLSTNHLGQAWGE